MKKIFLGLLLFVSIVSFAQTGSQSVSGIKYRVNDSTTYISAAASAHAQGYADIFWNNQANVPHFDIWNGSSYEHVFVFGGSGGGGGGSGTVNSGTANRLGFYSSTGTAISALSAITGNRLLISNSSGLPTHSTVTDTEAGYLSGVSSAIQTQINGLVVKSANLSDLTSASTARTNLGLGTLATQSGTFSGTSSGTNTGDQTTVSGNAGTATALQTARTIGIITGDATSSGSSFDATANNTNSLTVTKLNGTSLAGLATGILKNTTGTGVPIIATAGTDYQVPITAGDVTTSGATSTIGAAKVTNSMLAGSIDPVNKISGWPANASGVLSNNGSGTLSWGTAVQASDIGYNTTSGNVNILGQTAKTTQLGANGNIYQTISPNGLFTFAGSNVDAAAPKFFNATPGSYSNALTTTEITDYNFDAGREIRWATGTIANQRTFKIVGPTLAALGASTITQSSTLDVIAPIAGDNVTLSNNNAITTSGGMLVNYRASANAELFGIRNDQSAITRAALINATSGTTAGAQFNITTSSTIATSLSLAALSAGYSSSGINVANTGVVNSSMTGGLNVGTTASASTKLWTNNIARFTIDTNGANSMVQSVTSSAWAPALLVTPGAHTGMTTATEFPNYRFDGATQTAASGTTTTQRNFYIKRVTYAGTSGTRTVTNPYGLYVEDAAAGTNGAITNNYAIGTDGNIAMVTAGNKLFIKEGTNGSLGQVALVSGTKAITISGATTSTRAIVTFVSVGGTVSTTWQYKAVCTANTLTITAIDNTGSTNTLDTSTLNYFIIEPTP